MVLVKIYKYIEDFWFSFNQKIRFVLVGGFNTVFAYGLYAFLLIIVGMPYLLSLIVQHIISVNVSILTMRYYVFHSFGNFFKEYCKAWSVYIFMFAFNSVSLSFLIEICHINELAAQGIYIFVSAILTYIMHKYFSFSKK